MEIDEIAKALVELGCPEEKSTDMASQIDKRARQLAEERSQSYEQALGYLLSLMKEGWAAKERGF